MNFEHRTVTGKPSRPVARPACFWKAACFSCRSVILLDPVAFDSLGTTRYDIIQSLQAGVEETVVRPHPQVAVIVTVQIDYSLAK